MSAIVEYFDAYRYVVSCNSKAHYTAPGGPGSPWRLQYSQAGAGGTPSSNKVLLKSDYYAESRRVPEHSDKFES